MIARLAKVVFIVSLAACGLVSTALLHSQPPEGFSPFFNDRTSDSPLFTDREALERLRQQRGCGSGSIGWSQNGSIEIPGIYQAYLKVHCYKNREVTIWVDFDGSFGGTIRSGTRGGSSTHIDAQGHSSIEGHIESSVNIMYQLDIDDQFAGTATINGVVFDLDEGELFLVSTHSGAPVIKQLSYNLAHISSSDIRLLAIEHPEISGFFKFMYQ